ncbi:AAA-like domain-containing protein [Lyngbya sp. CCY1209]|uniref:AAA-like domain-containing protein n=1 Tax=Lyngbya sp. CCY1209 TaxID=2886103 RepID=UPI002D1FCD7B|nr:AAA-like domain-containing protein [Lyngbya sp. CCY1209]MEB3882093.1 AAA-like domain-containing protein [Lyngbya sp. CCY1209]
MFYQVGGSLKSDALCYVERDCDRDLYEALKRGEFCYVLNCRQMGKSSLMVRVRQKLQREGYKCATLDLTLIGGQNITPLQWYKGMIAELLRGFKLFKQFNLKTWWNDSDDISFLQLLGYFFDRLLSAEIPDQNIVIFIDEIDSILGLNFSVDDFFALIRFCYNQRATDPKFNRLTFALLGVATPSDLIQDRTRTPFNIGTAIALSGFSLSEVAPLARGLGSESGNEQEIIKEILDWTNGQPFLTQKICKIIGDNHRKNELGYQSKIPPRQEVERVEQIVRNRVIDEWQSKDEPEHLKTIRDRLFRNPRWTGRLLGIYQQVLQHQSVEVDDSREQAELLLSGLVVKIDGQLRLKNRIYGEVFNPEWVVRQLSELRPYSQAFDAWIVSEQQDESRLLRGQALKDAQTWAMGKSLSDGDYQFLSHSEKLDRREAQMVLEAARTREVEARLAEQQKRLQQEKKVAKLQRLFLAVVSLAFAVSAGMGLFARWQYRQAIVSEIIALVSSSKGLFSSQNQLEAMVAAIKAKRRADAVGVADKKIVESVETALNQVVYGSHEVNRLIGHKGSVLSVDITPDGELIATGSNDKTVKIWKEDGTLLATLEHSATIHRVAFGPDGKSLVSGSLDGTVKLWSVDGKLLRDIRAHDAPVWGVAFSPDGKKIASSAGDSTVKIWGLDGTLLKTFTGDEKNMWNVAFDSESQMIAVAQVDGRVKLWSIDGKFSKNLDGHRGPVWDVAFCPQTNLFVSVSSDQTAKLWRRDGTLVRTLQGEEALIGVDCSDRGPYIATSGQDRAVTIWHSDGTSFGTLREHKAVVRDVALSADGLTAASASDDGTVKLWQCKKNLLKSLHGHEDTVWDMAVSPDQKLIVSASNQTVQVWLSDGKRLRTITPSQPWNGALSFAPDSKIMAIGNSSQIELWNVEELKMSSTKPIGVLSGHGAAVTATAISPDGQIIASAGDDKMIRLWSIDGKLLRSFVAHKERIWRLAFTPDGQILASASGDRTVKLWTLDGELLTTQFHEGAVWGVAINPDGNLIASSGRDGTFKVWKLDGTLVRNIDGKSNGLTRIAFSPDGETIATAGVDNTIKLWNLEGELLRTLPGHQGMVIAVDFTPDGKFLVSGGDDRTVILWDLEKIETLNELEYACDWVRDYLRTNSEIEEGDRTLCDPIGRRSLDRTSKNNRKIR